MSGVNTLAHTVDGGERHVIKSLWIANQGASAITAKVGIQLAGVGTIFFFYRATIAGDTTVISPACFVVGDSGDVFYVLSSSGNAAVFFAGGAKLVL